MELRQLQYFRAVASAGSFSRASAQLGIAQPALSRQIQHLEEELGTRLLYRNGRGVFPTDAGARFLERLTEILLDLEDLATRTKEEAGRHAGVVTIGMPPALTALIAGSLATRVKKLMPDLQIRVVTGLSGHLNEWVLEKRLDVAVVYRARLSPVVNAEELLMEHLFLVGSKELARACRDSDTVPMLETADIPLILPTMQHAIRREVEEGATFAGTRLTIVMEIDSIHGIMSMVMAGHAFSVVPFSGMRNDDIAGKLRWWRLIDPEISNKMMLAMPSTRFPSSTLADLRQVVRAEIADQVAAGRLVGDIAA